MSTALIQAIKRRASDADGLSVVDRKKILDRFKGRIDESAIKAVLDIFADLIVDGDEVDKLVLLFGLSGSAKRRFERKLARIIGRKGVKLLKRHLKYLLKRMGRSKDVEKRIAAYQKVARYAVHARHLLRLLHRLLKKERDGKAAGVCATAYVRVRKPTIDLTKVPQAIARRFLSCRRYRKYPGLRSNTKLVLAAMRGSACPLKIPSAALKKDTDFLARRVILRPELFAMVPKKLQREVARKAIEHAIATGADISLLLGYLPDKLFNDRSLILPLLTKSSRYHFVFASHLLQFAPQLVHFPIRLALQAYALGITHGRRFPEDGKALAEIVENRTLAQHMDVHDPRPLAVVVYPKADHNQAFRAFTKVADLMRKGYFVLYYEVDNEGEAVAAVKRATRRRKAALIWFGGHGNRTSLALSAPDPRTGRRASEEKYLDVGDAKDLKGLGVCIVDGGHVVLESCSNGKGGKNAKNMLTFMAKVFPSAYVHAQMDDGYILPRFNAKGLFVGITTKPGIKAAAINRAKRYYKEYNPTARHIDLPHPPHRTTATAKGRIKRLKAIAAGHADPAVRVAAQRALGLVAWGTKKVDTRAIRIARHLDALGDGNKTCYQFDAARWGMIRLARIGRDAVPSLIRLLGHQAWHVRKRAVKTLGAIGDARAAHAILRVALHDPKPEVVKAAAAALGKLKYRGFVPALLKKLDSPLTKADKKILLLGILGVLKDPRALSRIIEIAKSHRFELGRAAVEALGAFGGKKAVKALCALLKMDEGDDYLYHSSVLKALGRIGDRRAIPAVMAALRKSDRIQTDEAAIEVLGRMKAKKAVKLIMGHVSSPYADVPHAAAKALGRIGDPAAITTLAKAMKDRDAALRKAAARAMGRIDHPRSRAALAAELKNKDRNLRAEAAIVLGERKDLRAVPHLIGICDAKYGVYSTDQVNRAYDALDALKGPKATRAIMHAINSVLAYRVIAKFLKKRNDLESARIYLAAFKVKDNYELHMVAKDALKNIADPRVAPLFVAALENPAAQKTALEALQRIKGIAGVRGPRTVKSVLRAYRASRGRYEAISTYDLMNALENIGGRAAAKALLQLMKLGKWEKRWATACLMRMKEKAIVPDLLSILADPSERFRAEAAKTLGAIGDSRAVPQLMRALKDREKEVRREAAIALGKLGDKRAVPWLLAIVNKDREHETSAVRAAAIRSLKRLGYTKMVGTLCRILGDAQYGFQARLAAAAYLCAFKDQRSTAALLKVLHNDALEIQTIAARGLRGRSDTQIGPALASLISWMEKKIAEGGSWLPWRMQRLMKLIGTIGNRAAVPAVVAYLKRLKPENVDARCDALRALGRIGGVQAVRAIVAFMEPIGSVSIQYDTSIEALIDANHPEGDAVVIRALKYPSNRLRYKVFDLIGKKKITRFARRVVAELDSRWSHARLLAAKAIRAFMTTKSMKSRDFIPILTRTLKRGRSYYVSEELIKALGETGDPRAIDVLIDHLDRRRYNSSLRHHAYEALKKFKDPRAIRAVRDYDAVSRIF